jgi:hypothetical protein
MTTRNNVERHPAALSNKQDFVLSDPEYFENYRNLYEKELNRSTSTLLCEKE